MNGSATNNKPMKRTLLIILLSAICLAAQPGGHIVAARVTWYATDYACDQVGIVEPFKTVIKYIATAESHQIMDRAINEAAIGDWQVDIGGTTYILGYFLVDDKEKKDYLQYATLGLFYDLWDKGLGRHDFHNYNGPMIFDYNRDNIDLAERLCILSFRMKISF